MEMPSLPPALIHRLAGLVAGYIEDQRRLFLGRAQSLTAHQRAEMSRFFSPEIIEEARLLVLVNERVANPDFYPQLRTFGFTNLPDQSTMAAVTFRDTVVSHIPFTSRLLFHELVHVEQYRQLGTTRFSELYVNGFLNGGGYDGIPLERNAYDLDARFAADPNSSFSVSEIVAEWTDENRY